MKITKLNYEVFALDYLEGNLSELQELEMLDFLKENPAIEAELLALQGFEPVAPETIVFENKAALLKKEKVVFLSPFWRRSLSIAAAILLLLTSYFIGYKDGNQTDIHSFVIQESSSNTQDLIPAEINRNEIAQEDEQPANNETIIENPPKQVAKRQAPLEKKKENPRDLAVEKSKESEPNQLEFIENPFNNQAEKTNNESPIIAERPTDAIVALPLGNSPLIAPNIKNHIEPAIISYSEQVLQNNQSLALEESKGKKIKFRNLFGRLPSFEGVKVSFIPTYYEDKIAGD